MFIPSLVKVNQLLHKVLQRHRQTDRQTDRQTCWHNASLSLLSRFNAQ